MIKKKKSSTKSLQNNESYLISKMSNIMDDAIPRTIGGMLVTGKAGTDDSILFYNRYRLIADSKNNYRIRDELTHIDLYKNVTLFISAINMIYCISKNTINSGFKDQQIYTQDQKYSRCIENIKNYKFFLKTTVDNDRRDVIAHRLEHDMFRLQEIKTELFKIF